MAPSLASLPRPLWLLALVGTACFFQFPRSVDYVGYLQVVDRAFSSGFTSPPYPQVTARVGDYFQSPVVTLLLVPFTKIPVAAAKLIWALLLAGGLWASFRS